MNHNLLIKVAKIARPDIVYILKVKNRKPRHSASTNIVCHGKEVVKREGIKLIEQRLLENMDKLRSISFTYFPQEGTVIDRRLSKNGLFNGGDIVCLNYFTKDEKIEMKDLLIAKFIEFVEKDGNKFCFLRELGYHRQLDCDYDYFNNCLLSCRIIMNQYCINY